MMFLIVEVHCWLELEKTMTHYGLFALCFSNSICYFSFSFLPALKKSWLYVNKNHSWMLKVSFSSFPILSIISQKENHTNFPPFFLPLLFFLSLYFFLHFCLIIIVQIASSVTLYLVDSFGKEAESFGEDGEFQGAFNLRLLICLFTFFKKCLFSLSQYSLTTY